MTIDQARALVAELDPDQLDLVAATLELDRDSAAVALIAALLDGVPWGVILMLLDDGEPCEV